MKTESGPIAGIAAETLNCIEGGRHAPSVATMAKIDRALADAQRKR